MKFTRKITLSAGDNDESKTMSGMGKSKIVKRARIKEEDLAEMIKKILKTELDDRTRWKQYAPELQKIITKPPKDVLGNVKYKERAIKLLDSLNGDVTWDADGAVSVKGVKIPYSHIGELVEAYFNPTTARPIGWETFKPVLPRHGETKDASTEWEEWPRRRTPLPKRSPIPRLTKQGKRTRKNLF